MKVPAQLIKALRQNKSFVMTTHTSPEGDAVGSEVALALLLKRLKKRVEIINKDPLPEQLAFLPHNGFLRQDDKIPPGFDVLCILDCGDLERTGFGGSSSLLPPLIINIDHHVTNRRCCHINWVEKNATATGEMIYDLANALSIPLDKGMALAIFTSIFTETGSFRYMNTTPRILRMAAELTEKGVAPWVVAENLYEKNSPHRLRLLGELLLRMERSSDGRIAWFTATRDLFKKTGTTSEDTEEMVNYPRSLKGVDVAMFFREVGPDSYKISFRSKGKVDVARLAEKFGGGGHKNAAGCRLPGSQKEVEERVLKVVEDGL